MNVVLVHGAWADGSSWALVVERLQTAGHRVVAAQLPMTSLEADVDATRRAVARIDADIVVGHSYGGVVISAAADAMPSVRALVFVAAYAPEVGETLASISEEAAEMPGGHAIVYAEDGWTSVAEDAYGEALAHDLPRTTQDVLAAVQTPTHVSCFVTANTVAAWAGLPCFSVVATEDRILDPELQRDHARRIDAHVTEVAGSHLVLLSHADEVSTAIRTAAAITAASSTRPSAASSGSAA